MFVKEAEDKAPASPQLSSSPLERLPLELRLKIYQAYLDSPILEHQENLRHEDITRAHPNIAQYKFYRQDPNEGSGFWSPFGMTMTSQWALNSSVIYEMRGLERRSPAALWHVGGMIAAEARDFMVNERMRFVFTNEGFMNQLKAKFRDWQKWAQAHTTQGVRKAYMDVEYCLEGTDSDHISLHDSHHPLFKIEILDKGGTLRVTSLYQIAPKLVELTESAIKMTFMHGGSAGPRTARFGGRDIFHVIESLLAVPALVKVKQLDDSFLWQICLEPRDVDGPAGDNVNSVTRKDIRRPSTYRHVVAVLELDVT